jgi:hypothetical protein
MRFYDLDIDVKNYAKRIIDAGYKCPTDINSVSDFVKGLKILNLWGNMICWPLRSTQNAGSGSMVYSLGGYRPYNSFYDGIIYRTIWQQNGAFFPYDGNFNYIDIPSITQQFNVSHSVFAVGALTPTSSTVRRYIGVPTQSASELTAETTANTTSMTGIDTWSESIYSYISFSGDLSGFNWLGFSFDYSTSSNNVEGQKNTTFGTTSRASDPSAPTRQFTIGGGQGLVDNFTGTMAFAAKFFVILSQSDKIALYSLYKSTLGKGLGLP